MSNSSSMMVMMSAGGGRGGGGGRSWPSTTSVSASISTTGSPLSWVHLVIFKTRIYHCNVDSAGNVSLDILKDGWSLTISKVLLALRSIFTNPDSYKPLVPGIAHSYLADRAKHDELAAEWTHRFAR